jgi:parallel beta-helix repeat protein
MNIRGKEIMKKAYSGIMLMMQLISMLTLTFGIQQAKSEPNTIVVPDDYATIQKAVDAANLGDTIYVRAGIYRENVVASKTVSLVGENRATTIIDGLGSGTVVYVTANNVNISGFTIRNSGVQTVWPPDSGIILWYSDRSTITNCNITSNGGYGFLCVTSRYYTISNSVVSHNNHIGIAIGDTGSSNGVIRNNTVCLNRGSGGIEAYWGSDYTIVENNTVCNNAWIGIAIGWSQYCVIRNNILWNNVAGGVVLDTTSYCSVANNEISNSTYGGVTLLGLGNYFNNILNNTVYSSGAGIDLGANARYTKISGNIMSMNEYGLRISNAPGYENLGNKIFHNDFINNKQQAVDNATNIPVPNVWDDGYPSGGNYWSDYSGKDEDGDGIGDVPYRIGGTACSRDCYPLMNPQVAVVRAKIDVKPDTLNLRSRGNWVTVYIELPACYKVADIDVSSIMLNGTVHAEPRPASIGDYDNDGVPDLMVKFDRAKVIRFISSSIGKLGKFMTVTLTITGELHNRASFRGSDEIRIRSK